MPITEHQVSILIPSYRRPEMTRRALRSALASGAGEIIVSDDASNDGTVEALRDLATDPRLRIVVQPKNLGLWPNHLALLRMAGKPWIKFLQNDDWLEEGGLQRMVEQITPQTTLVASLSCYHNAESGLRRVPRLLSRPRRFSSDEYIARLAVTGNEPGTPSDALWRADALDHSDAAWRNDISVDLLCNVLAASRGEVVLMPAGAVVTLDHAGRDTHLQGFALHVKRLRNTVEYLLEVPDDRVRQTTRILAWREAVGVLRMAVGQWRRRQWLYKGFWRDLAAILLAGLHGTTLRNLVTVCRSVRWKFFADSRGVCRDDQPGVNLDTDQVLRRVEAVSPTGNGPSAAAPAAGRSTQQKEVLT